MDDFEAHAVIRPAEDSYHTRVVFVALHSAHRDRARFPSAADFTVDLDEPLLDVSYVRVRYVRVPERASRVVRAGSNALELAQVGSDVRTRVEVAAGFYDGATLADAVQDALRRAVPSAVVRYDPIARGVRLSTDPFATGFLRVVGGGLARVLGFGVAQQQQRELARDLEFAASGFSAAEWVAESDVFAGLSPGAEVRVRVPDGRVFVGRVRAPRVVHLDDADLPDSPVRFDVVSSEIASEGPVRLDPGPPVLSINGLRRVESPHAALHATFGQVPVPWIELASPMAKHMTPPMHMIRRLHVRLTDELGDLYDLPNAEWSVELEVGTIRPGTRSVPRFMVS